MNQLSILQVLGMTRYEFRMHWRRRGVTILSLAILFVVVISLLIAGDSVSQMSALEADPDIKRQVITAALILTIWAPIGVGIAFFLPIIASDTIPLDKQYGVRELLDTLPLSPNAYFIGKLLGLWVAVLGAMGIVMLLVGALWWLRVGAFNLGIYFEVWLVGVASIVVLNGSLGVLLPAALPTRRQGILTTVMGLVILTTIFREAVNKIDLRGMANPLRGPIINYYLFHLAEPLHVATPISGVPMFQTVLLTILVGLVEVAILFVLMRLWTSWRDAQQ